jgi:hypothetical protein
MNWRARIRRAVMTVKGYYDGKKILLDEAPTNVRPNCRVQVTVEPVDGQEDMPEGVRAGGILNEIAQSSQPGGLHADFSEQHSHYLKGAPRR